MKWYCTVCGYVYEGPTAPEFCPQCKAPASKFKEVVEGASFATVHEVGVAQGVSEDILKDLRANFEGECSEVGMYLAMARVAHREGYPEIGQCYHCQYEGRRRKILRRFLGQSRAPVILRPDRLHLV